MRKILPVISKVVYFLINVYIASKYYYFCQLFFKKGTIIIPVIIMFFSLSTLFQFVFIDKNIGRKLGNFANYWQGIIAIQGILFALSDIIFALTSLFLTSKIDKLPWMVCVQVVGIFIFTVLYMGVGRKKAKDLVKTRYALSINKSTTLEELKVVVLTDIHLGYSQNDKFLADVVKKVNEEQPDIVCIVGDIFDNNVHAIDAPEKIIQIFNSIESKYGTYACWGNHDAGRTFSEMKELISRTTIHLLEDDYCVVDNAFILVGRQDITPLGNQGKKRGPLPTGKLPRTMFPIIVMDHQPSTIHEYHEADLILCGHTHHGQVFPINIVTQALFDVDYGYYQESKNSPQVIVSSGVGTAGPPIRIGTKSEIVCIEITFDS